MQILLIIILYFYYQIINFAAAASVLENVCNAYKSALNFTTTAFFENQCFLIFRIIGIPYLSIKPMCDETMRNASASCHVIHYNGSTVIQDFMITQLNIKPNDRFFTGLSRDTCASPWLWRNFDNTTSPFVSSIISLPEVNSDCEENVQGYDSGSLGPVSAETFNATSFICECFSNSSPLLSTSPPIITSTVSTLAAVISTTPSIPTLPVTTTTVPLTTVITPSIPPTKSSKETVFCCNFKFIIIILLVYFIL